MERRKNIVIFTGKSESAKRKEISAWISRFVDKYGDSNLVRIRKDSFSAQSIATELLSPPFFSEKRLVIFDDLLSAPSVPKKESTSDRPQSEGEAQDSSVGEKSASGDSGSEMESAVLSVYENIPDTSVVVFIATEANETSKLYIRLLETADVKNYPELAGSGARSHACEKLPGISKSALDALLSRTEGKEWALIEGVEKLSLAYGESKIDAEAIDEAVPDFDEEANVFALADAIASGDEKSLSALSVALSQKSPHEILPTILSTFRKRIRIDLLLALGESVDAVRKKLGAKDFEITRRQRASEKDRKKLSFAYGELVRFQADSRIGNVPGADDETALSLAVTAVIIGLRKF